MNQMGSASTERIVELCYFEKDFEGAAHLLLRSICEPNAWGCAFCWDDAIEEWYPVARSTDCREHLATAQEQLKQELLGESSTTWDVLLIHRGEAVYGAILRSGDGPQLQPFRAAATTVLAGRMDHLRIGELERQRDRFLNDRERFNALLKNSESRQLRREKLAAEERARELQEHMQELERALAKAQESSRLKSEFLATVSHEVRTPLNAILVLPQLLLEDFNEVEGARCQSCCACYELGPEETMEEPCPQCGGQLEPARVVINTGAPQSQQEILRDVLQQSQGLTDLLTAILDFSRLEAKRVKLTLRKHRVADVIERTVLPFRRQAALKGVALEVECPSRLTGTFDLERISQVLINLVSNALKFTDAGGTVTISAQCDGDGILLEAKDTGTGIANDEVENIFGSFRQVDGSHTRSHGGVGLGLAIVKEIVELHRGRVWVESTLGQGSTFRVRVPGPAATSERTASAGH